MKKIGCFLVVAVGVILAVCICRSDSLSLEEQIARQQKIQSDKVEIVQAPLVLRSKTLVGFIDGEGEPGVALFSKEENPELLAVYRDFFSRVPRVWSTYIVLDGILYLVILSDNTELASVQWKTGKDGIWERIVLSPEPTMIYLPLDANGETLYLLCDSNGDEL